MYLHLFFHHAAISSPCYSLLPTTPFFFLLPHLFIMLIFIYSLLGTCIQRLSSCSDTPNLLWRPSICQRSQSSSNLSLRMAGALASCHNCRGRSNSDSFTVGSHPSFPPMCSSSSNTHEFRRTHEKVIRLAILHFPASHYHQHLRSWVLS